MVDLRRSWFNRICGTVLVLVALIVTSSSLTAHAGNIENNVNVNAVDVPIAPDVGAGGVTAIIEFVACDDGAGGVVLVGVMDTDEGAYCERSGQGPTADIIWSWTAGASPTNHIGKTPMTSVNQNQFCYSFREPQAIRVARIVTVNVATGESSVRNGTLVLRC